LSQFLSQVEWGSLDYLVADLPPGTGDEIITLTQKMEPDLAIIVTTPQEVSLNDSGRAINMAREMKVPKIVLIENMSGCTCPHCGGQIELFGTGGGQKQADQMHVTFLGKLPIDVKVRKLADIGRPIMLENEKAEISSTLNAIVKKVTDLLND
jgi:ATP-binding protein involved in chromosome partitioning